MHIRHGTTDSLAYAKMIESHIYGIKRVKITNLRNISILYEILNLNATISQSK
jgi:hypothetical protein